MRETGYYWINYNGKWYIGYYDKAINVWSIVNSKYTYSTVELKEIDERQIIRN